MYEIKKYSTDYEDGIMELITAEGEDWEIYWGKENNARYRKSFEQSITYVALDNGNVCGYSRSLQDALFIYVCDLLVSPKCRGNSLGEKLMRCLEADYPDLPVYIMSGNDIYYNKINCSKEGSIYLLTPKA